MVRLGLSLLKSKPIQHSLALTVTELMSFSGMLHQALDMDCLRYGLPSTRYVELWKLSSVITLLKIVITLLSLCPFKKCKRKTKKDFPRIKRRLIELILTKVARVVGIK